MISNVNTQRNVRTACLPYSVTENDNSFPPPQTPSHQYFKHLLVLLYLTDSTFLIAKPLRWVVPVSATS